MAPHSSTLAWRIPGTREPGGLPSMGSHRVGHNWSDLAAAAVQPLELCESIYQRNQHPLSWKNLTIGQRSTLSWGYIPSDSGCWGPLALGAAAPSEVIRSRDHCAPATITLSLHQWLLGHIKEGKCEGLAFGAILGLQRRLYSDPRFYTACSMLTATPGNRYCHDQHCTGKITVAQRCQAACPSSHSRWPAGALKTAFFYCIFHHHYLGSASEFQKKSRIKSFWLIWINGLFTLGGESYQTL